MSSDVMNILEDRELRAASCDFALPSLHATFMSNLEPVLMQLLKLSLAQFSCGFLNAADLPAVVANGRCSQPYPTRRLDIERKCTWSGEPLHVFDLVAVKLGDPSLLRESYLCSWLLLSETLVTGKTSTELDVMNHLHMATRFSSRDVPTPGPKCFGLRASAAAPSTSPPSAPCTGQLRPLLWPGNRFFFCRPLF